MQPSDPFVSVLEADVAAAVEHMQRGELTPAEAYRACTDAICLRLTRNGEYVALGSGASAISEAAHPSGASTVQTRGGESRRFFFQPTDYPELIMLLSATQRRDLDVLVIGTPLWSNVLDLLRESL
ncbi:MAG: hypothetical protein ACYSWX_05880 [Planctomycetota bacterium]